MSKIVENIKGTANKAVGKAKTGVGKVMDKPDVVAKGTAQKIKGNLQMAKGSVSTMGNKKK